MRPKNGGLPARRAVIRWAWRLFRREWRQQLLVLALLTFAVAAAVIGVSAGANLAPVPEGRFGTAEQLLKYDGSEPQGLDARIAAARQWFGTIDVIGHRYLPIPGSVNNVELRAQNPTSGYGAAMVRLRSGQYPAGADQVAVTDDMATILKLRVGSPLTLAGRTFTVVGMVENPGDLGDEFILVAPGAGPPESVTILTAAAKARFDQFLADNGHPSVVDRRDSFLNKAIMAAVFGFVTVGMLLVCLVAAAGFAVLAQRRLRQLGMFAAIGATQRHLRLTLLANGAAMGVTAAVLGTVAGLALWVLAAPQLESTAQHRIDRFSLPWWPIAVAMLLAVATATAAAWRPARAVARVPITLALSARPPRPKPVRRSAVVAVLLIAAGVGCLRLAKQSNPPYIIAGTLATAVGLLFLGPLAIRVLAAAGARLPVAPRLALRDLARHQARSGAALAAISLALAIPVAIVISAAAQAYTTAEGNLSDRQLMIMVGRTPGIPERSPAELASMEARVRSYAATLGNPTMIPLDKGYDPAARPQLDPGGGPAWRPSVFLAVPSGPNRFTTDGDMTLYVGTPELLHYYGIDPGGISPDVDVLSTHHGQDLRLLSAASKEFPAARTAPLKAQGYMSVPASLLTPAALQRNGWSAVRVGWFVEAAKPLTAAQLAAARDLAVDAGLTVESRDTQTSLLVLRSTATAIGAALALAVLALTVGLIRAEAAGDLRTLTATGASRRIRRTLTATTAGGLALLGALLGITVAYAALAAGYGHLSALRQVPVVDLTVTAVGVPLLAAIAGWLLAGREPGSLTRPRLE